MTTNKRSGEHRLNLMLENVDPKDLEKARQQAESEARKMESRFPEEDVAITHTMKAARQFEQGMDAVTDVLLTLVLKFGRATTWLVGMGALLVVCIIVLIVSLVNIGTLSSQVADLQMSQHEIARIQRNIERKTNETSTKVLQTEQRVRQTAEAVDKAKAIVVPTPSDKGKRLKLEIDSR